MRRRFSQNCRFQDLLVFLGIASVLAALWTLRGIVLPSPIPASNPPPTRPFLTFLGPANISDFLPSTDSPLHPSPGPHPMQLSQTLDLHSTLSEIPLLPIDELPSPSPNPPPPLPSLQTPSACLPTPFHIPTTLPLPPPTYTPTWHFSAPQNFLFNTNALQQLCLPLAPYGECSVYLLISPANPLPQDSASASSNTPIVESILFQKGCDSIPPPIRSQITLLFRSAILPPGFPTHSLLRISWRWSQ